MSSDALQALITNQFQSRARKDSNIHNAHLLVHSDKHGLHLKLAEGSTDNKPAHVDQPFYIASISKLFTSVLVALLADQGLIAYNDRIADYLDRDLMHHLHIYKGKDYSKDILIKHLLNHTSGLHDFFEDKPKHSKSLFELVKEEPTRFWTPLEVVQWAKSHLKPHFPPGKGFHYSDTGYHLLGLLIEQVTAMPLHEAFHHYIFGPLGMKHTHFAYYSKPEEESEHPVAHLYEGRTDMTHYESLSVAGYAGGGVVSTTEDLLIFMKSLVHHKLLRQDQLEAMKDWATFYPGIAYGYGMMSFKTVPLFMPKKYNAWGNAGSTGTFMFYHPATESYIIGGLNHFRYFRKGFRLLFKIIDILSKPKG